MEIRLLPEALKGFKELMAMSAGGRHLQSQKTLHGLEVVEADLRLAMDRLGTVITPVIIAPGYCDAISWLVLKANEGVAFLRKGEWLG